MKTVYNGKYLSIEHEEENCLFIQSWKSTPNNIDTFKTEMLRYTEFYKKLRPKYTLWQQKEFELPIDDELKLWIEQYVNKPCLEYGNEKCAFVISDDLLIHLETMEVFEKTNSDINVKHFSSVTSARNWIFENDHQSTNNEAIPNKIKISYEGEDSDNNAIIKIKIPSSRIKDTLNIIKKAQLEEQFISHHKGKFNTLTKSEKNTLKLILEGYTNQQIAESTYVSVNTIRTHRNRIWKKLDVHSLGDCMKFKPFFETEINQQN